MPWPAPVARVTPDLADGQLAVAMLMRIFQSCQRLSVWMSVKRMCCLYLQSNRATGSRTAQTFTCRYDVINDLRCLRDAVPFQPFLSTISPLLAHTSLFISLHLFILVQFMNLISLHTERRKKG